MMPTNKTAVLAFVREPSQEAQVKQLWGQRGSRRNSYLFRQLNGRLRRIIQRSGLPMLWLDEDRQQGETFGERLSAGLKWGFQQGFERIIIVGNDCPNLRVCHLLGAAQQLEHHQWVVGPDRGGGAYLLGVDQMAFKADEFEVLPWQTSQLFTAVLDLSSADHTYLLDVEKDINCQQDLQSVLVDLGVDHVLSRLLIGAFIKRHRRGRAVPVYRGLQLCLPTGLRAPPSLAN